VLAIFPPIVCLWLTKDVRLTRAQNAIDGRDLTGKSTQEAVDPDLLEAPSVRLRVGSSPSRSFSRGTGTRLLGHKASSGSGWRADLESVFDGDEEEAMEGRRSRSPTRYRVLD
jgi:hypothetical protein